MAMAVERGGWRPRPAAPLPPPQSPHPALPPTPAAARAARRATRRPAGADPDDTRPAPSLRRPLPGARAPWATLEGQERRPGGPAGKGREVGLAARSRGGLRGQDLAQASPKIVSDSWAGASSDSGWGRDGDSGQEFGCRIGEPIRFPVPRPPPRPGLLPPPQPELPRQNPR